MTGVMELCAVSTSAYRHIVKFNQLFIVSMLLMLINDEQRVNCGSSSCVFRKKRGYLRSATSWLSDRLYVTAADPPRVRIRTTTPRRPRPSRTPSPCFPRRATPTPPRTITPSRLPSPTPPTSTQQTAR